MLKRIALSMFLAAIVVRAVGDNQLTKRTIELNRKWAESAMAGYSAAWNGNLVSIFHDDAPGTAKVNRSAAGKPLRLGEKTYKHGFGVNSLCILRVALQKPVVRFLADIGLDRNVDDTTPASVRFRVQVGGRDVFSTPVIRPKDGVRRIDIPLNGTKEFDLVVDDGGDGRGWDQGDWADARVVFNDGKTLRLDSLAKQAYYSNTFPISFVYGGKPSSELLPNWKRVIRKEATKDRQKEIIEYADPETGLEVSVVATVYLDTPGVEWTLQFSNRGTRDTPILEEVKPVDLSVVPGIGNDVVLHRLKGSAVGVEDWMPIDEPLESGRKIEFGSVEGRTSIAASPFFTLDWESGGVVTAIGWSGNWSATVERAESGVVRLHSGMQRIHTILKPGETMRSPRILQVHYAGCDCADAHNLFRRTMLAHILPKESGKAVAAPIAHLSTSFYEMNDSTEANTLSHLKAIKGLGFEVFWLDAYWTRGGFPNGMGNYGFPLSRVEPPDRFPHGLKPIGEAAHKAGMKFLVWFEPERVAAGTFIAREHPEWVISPSGDGSGLFNLGIAEAREYMTRYLIAAVREYGIDWLRFDYNINPLPFWEFMNRKDPDRIGIAEIRYLEGLYKMWDDIRTACPGMQIDNCASGGTRIDLETCSRSIPLWRTDDTIGPLFDLNFNQAAIQNQLMTEGLTRYVPFSASGQMGASPYLFRSGFNGGISFAEDCRPAKYPRAMLKQAIAEGKRIRKYWYGDFHPLSMPSTRSNDWCVLQFHLPSSGDGLVVAFRRHESPYAVYEAQLREIDPAAHYLVTCSHGYKPEKAVAMRGKELKELRIAIDERPGSVLVEYKRVKE